MKRGFHKDRLLMRIDVDVSADIRRAHMPFEFLETDRAVGIGQIAGHAVGRGLRDGDACQRVEERHVRAGKMQCQIGALKVDRIVNRAAQRDIGRAVGEAPVDRIGVCCIRQAEQGTTDDMACDRGLRVPALEVDDEMPVIPVFGSSVWMRTCMSVLSFARARRISPSLISILPSFGRVVVDDEDVCDDGSEEDAKL